MTNSRFGDYGRTINSEVLTNLDELNEKIEKEENPEELMKLRLQRLYKGMEINTGSYNPYGKYFPY